MKRIFDILVSAFGIVLCTPIWLIVPIAIKLDSKGPVFYRQIRVGRHNKDFAIFKFRSMFVDSDKGSLITIGGRDNRITRVGYYLRQCKIDELPQLFNVFLGEMSFVGPRPEVRRYVDLYTPEQLQVLELRPGITDAASIKYRNENELLAAQTDPEKYYIEVVMPDKLSINLAYLQHHNLWIDLRLICQTILTILH